MRMQKDYYQNILYPLQDKVLNLLGSLPVDFYLTGGTALSRAYLNHRYSDDLDFFVNQSPFFKTQVETIIRAIPLLKLNYNIAQADEGYARIFIKDEHGTLKLDFVNDVLFRSGHPVNTGLYRFTDTVENILSNKISALSRYEPKDVADILFIANKFSFHWPDIISDASQKDFWVNPVEVARMLDEFPLYKMKDINWVHEMPDFEGLETQLKIIIRDILQGTPNSLFA